MGFRNGLRGCEAAASNPSHAEQAASQQGLYVPPAIGDEENIHMLAQHSINHPVRLNERLSILTHTQRRKFLRERAAFGECRKALDYFLDAVESIVRLGRAIVRGD